MQGGKREANEGRRWIVGDGRQVAIDAGDGGLWKADGEKSEVDSG